MWPVNCPRNTESNKGGFANGNPYIGHQLGTALIDYARKIGAKRLYLEGNTKLEASIHLYRKLGFHEISLEGSTYDRCDIIMELKL